MMGLSSLIGWLAVVAVVVACATLGVVAVAGAVF